jgi:hypothetical protein
MQTAPIDKISFKNLDIGYEPFAQALRGIGFDWQIGRSEDIQVYFVTPGGSPQRFFTLPATSKGPDGEDLSEYAVVSGVWSGVGESVAVLKKPRPGKLIKARSMQLDGHTLTFEVS